MTMKIYIAGPMRGYPEFNFPAFTDAEQALRSMFPDATIFSPARRDLEHGFDPIGLWGTENLAALGFDLREALAADTDWITRHATHIVLLPGWEVSSGARAEHALAAALGHEIWYMDAKGELYQGDPKDLPEQTGEVRVTNAATGGQKGSKPERYDLIPVKPLAELARVYGHGAKKYAARNWERGYEWSLSYAALQRHVNSFWGGETWDDESGLHHLAHAIFHCMSMIEWDRTHPELDDRPSGGPADEGSVDEFVAWGLEMLATAEAVGRSLVVDRHVPNLENLPHMGASSTPSTAGPPMDGRYVPLAPHGDALLHRADAGL